MLSNTYTLSCDNNYMFLCDNNVFLLDNNQYVILCVERRASHQQWCHTLRSAAPTGHVQHRLGRCIGYILAVCQYILAVCHEMSSIVGSSLCVGLTDVTRRWAANH